MPTALSERDVSSVAVPQNSYLAKESPYREPAEYWVNPTRQLITAVMDHLANVSTDEDGNKRTTLLSPGKLQAIELIYENPPPGEKIDTGRVLIGGYRVDDDGPYEELPYFRLPADPRLIDQSGIEGLRDIRPIDITLLAINITGAFNLPTETFTAIADTYNQIHGIKETTNVTKLRSIDTHTAVAA